MPGMSADLSVIIPTYKRKESLLLLLDKLAVQTRVRLEIIIVDQNHPDFWSTDELYTLGKYTRIVQETPNASLARNKGFLFSSSAHVLFLDDDLVPEENFCFKGLDIFQRFKFIRAFVPNVFTYEGVESNFEMLRRKKIGKMINKDLFRITDSISAAVFFEKKYYNASGGFDPVLFDFAKTAEDQEFFLRMLKLNMELWFVNEVQIFHNEKVAGGCELRTQDYWITRKKCIQSWAMRYRVHNHPKGSLGMRELLLLSRSCFLNKSMLSGNPKAIFKNMGLMIDAIRESKKFFAAKKPSYTSPSPNFLQ